MNAAPLPPAGPLSEYAEDAAPAPGVAVIGFAGRFPGADSVDAFWDNLREGRCAGRPLPEAPGGDEPGMVRFGYTLDGIDRFDAAFFDIAPREAALMDPQHRLFLECAWNALEHAGIAPGGDGPSIGVFAGCNFNTYLWQVSRGVSMTRPSEFFDVVLGNDKDYLATRVSYKLDLRGPSVLVQSACSTSLTAIATAAQALLAGQCDVALAGGAGIRAQQDSGYRTEEDGALSADGRVRAFSDDASGVAEGNGVGAVVLKRLDDALADGNTIYAVVRGFAVNNDGAGKAGFSAPSVAGQAAAIAEALAMAGVPTGSVGYVEAHGTGTPIGDPIEIAALHQGYGPPEGAPGACGIGSVKSNIGHLNAAAGVAAFLKTVLVLHHGVIPPSLHFRAANPRIAFADSRFAVVERGRPWPPGPAPRRAAVSSFGLGGTNVHMILEEAPPAPPFPPAAGPHLLTLSARSEDALARRIADLAGWLENSAAPDLEAVARTLNQGRRAFEHRCAIVADSPRAAVKTLRGAGLRKRCGRIAGLQARRSVAFVFPGAGPQHPGMGAGLHSDLPVYRAGFDHCAALFLNQAGIDIRPFLAPILDDEPREALAARLASPRVGMAALFSVEYALAGQLRAWGIQPDSLIGHSLGEYVAATLAGVFSLETAVHLVAVRAALIERTEAGAMMMVPLSEREAAPYLGEAVSLAVVTGPNTCVLSGGVDALAALAERLDREGRSYTMLAAERAGHSPLLDPILEEFRRAVAAVPLAPPAIPMISNLTGSWLTAAEATDPDYWVRHLRHTVRLSDGIEELAQDGGRLFLEVGPGRGLSALLLRHPAIRETRRVVPTMPAAGHEGAGREGDVAALLDTLGRLWLGGLPIDLAGGPYRDRPRRAVALPVYPFDGQRHWIDATPADTGPDVTEASGPDGWLHLPIWVRRPWSQTPADASPRVILLLDDDGVGGVAGPLASRLRDAGHRVETLAATADPRPLLAAMDGAGTPIDTILHLANLAQPPDGADVEARYAFHHGRAYTGLVELARRLAETSRSRPLRIVVAARGLARVLGDEPLEPLRALLLGPCRVIPFELPEVVCTAVDAAWNEPDERVAEALARVVVTGSGADAPLSLVAVRHDRLWVMDTAPVDLPAAVMDDAPPVPLVKPGGTYLILGGGGGIGLSLARHLANQARTLQTPGQAAGASIRLLLVQRSPIADPAAADSLRALGAEVVVLTADAGDDARMRALFQEIDDRFGGLDGVIHAAGVSGGGLMQAGVPDGRTSNLGAKARGVLILDALCAGRALDFVILCSSLGAFSGTIGQVDNTAGNAVLDAWAQAGGPPSCRRCLTINWDVWRDVGLIVELGERHRRITGEATVHGLSPADAGRALDRLLVLDEPQVAVSLRPLAAMLADLRRRRAEATATFERADLSGAGGARPDLATPFEPPRHDLDRCLLDILESRLGIAGIGIHDDYVELGGDSLLAMPLTAQIRDSLAVPFPVATLFRTRTAARIADHLLEADSGGARLPTLAGVLQRVKAMTPDQVSAALVTSDVASDASSHQGSR